MTAAACGQLVIGGFTGTSLPESFGRALAQRRRGGAILFKRNLLGDPRQVAALVRSIRAATDDAALVGVDQEGGRVARLGAPLLEVPAMRTVASWGDVALAERIAHAVGTELAALGFTIDFAPVLDVSTCAESSVIGDRAFGDDAATCARFGAAWIRGLQHAGLLACGKHFPGHGGTSKDSHVDLPVVDRRREDLERVELSPFRAAVAADVAALMTAHIVYSDMDPQHPATFSRVACTELRTHIGFRGMMISDDLEMQAIAARYTIEDAAVQAIGAGCDALLICSNEDLQERAVDALDREVHRSAAFRARCEEACGHLIDARKRAKARPADDASLGRLIGGRESVALASEIARRLGS
jgi:beta-N-acetylhexosaminidase